RKGLDLRADRLGTPDVTEVPSCFTPAVVDDELVPGITHRLRPLEVAHSGRRRTEPRNTTAAVQVVIVKSKSKHDRLRDSAEATHRCCRWDLVGVADQDDVVLVEA